MSKLSKWQKLRINSFRDSTPQSSRLKCEINFRCVTVSPRKNKRNFDVSVSPPQMTCLNCDVTAEFVLLEPEWKQSPLCKELHWDEAARHHFTVSLLQCARGQRKSVTNELNLSFFVSFIALASLMTDSLLTWTRSRLQLSRSSGTWSISSEKKQKTSQ